MNDYESIESLLRETPPAVPRIVEADVSRIRMGSQKRRRHRWATAAAMGTAALGLVIFFTASLAIKNRAGSTRPAMQSVSTDPGAPAMTPASLEATSPPASAASNETRERRRFRVYATVQDQLPVFGFDQRSRKLLHLGWVESETTLPVDLESLPSDQQQTVRAVLTEDDSVVHL